MSITEADWLADIAPERSPIGRPARVAGKPIGRSRKLACPSCGFIARATRGALERSGLPTCGCGERLALTDLADRAAVEWDALEAELLSYGRSAYNAAMRELGEPVEVESGGEYGRGGAERARCQWEGGYCAKFVSGRYCPEHEGERPEMGATWKGRA